MGEAETLTQGTYGACHRCGEPAGAFRFCLSCGASMEAADRFDPEPATEVPGPSHPRRGLRRIARWRTALVVLPLLGGLGVVAGVGAQMMTARISEPGAPAGVMCWDGGVVEGADSCTMPTGQLGLRWVFPRFHPGRDDCVDVLGSHPEYDRPAMYECDFKVAGHWVKVAYIQLAGVDPARRFFEKDFPDSERDRVRTAEGTAYRYVWRQRTEGGFELASMYIDFPYAVSITAAKALHRDLAFRRLEFRHPDRISVAEDHRTR
ncbi:MAG: hypothetical protein M3237_09100 [Actinomycetota bacterium]|nr:hypothetical protein [Actinomycetota bacterium]